MLTAGARVLNVSYDQTLKEYLRLHEVSADQQLLRIRGHSPYLADQWDHDTLGPVRNGSLISSKDIALRWLESDVAH
jgi:hypothetical protein